MLSGSIKLAMKKCALRYCLNRDFVICNFFFQFLMTTRLGVDLLPEVKPDVENMLKKCLAQEVELYKMNVQGRKCKLCPFRTFERSNRLHAHLKYHNVNNMYVARLQSPQLNVIRALFDHRRTVRCLKPMAAEKTDLLQTSQCLIAE